MGEASLSLLLVVLISLVTAVGLGVLSVPLEQEVQKVYKNETARKIIGRVFLQPREDLIEKYSSFVSLKFDELFAVIESIVAKIRGFLLVSVLLAGVVVVIYIILKILSFVF